MESVNLHTVLYYNINTSIFFAEYKSPSFVPTTVPMIGDYTTVYDMTWSISWHITTCGLQVIHANLMPFLHLQNDTIHIEKCCIQYL